ncbi:hypothetical protein GCM10009527_047830 [Actinomadura nitritigenes]
MDEALMQRSPHVYNLAIVRGVPTRGRLVVGPAVKVKMPGSEERLALMLDAYGCQETATDFLNSSSARLADAARRWARAHGYRIFTRPGVKGRDGASSEHLPQAS